MREQLRQLWAQLDLRQRVVLGAVAIGTLTVLVAMGIWASRPSYEVLYSGLSAADSGAALEHLRSEKIDYRLTNGGATIEVPRESVHEARLDLARKGLPQGGTVGFEIFDQSGLPGTDFVNKISHLRALQGELTRTIEELREVQWARVHLVIPQPALFVEEETPPTASVVLGVLAGSRLPGAEVRAITHLVGSAVDRLDPGHVTVLDSNGNLLAPGQGDAEGAHPATLTTAQLQAQRSLQEDLRRRVQTMLDHTLGPGRSIVRVWAELDFDTEETTNETVEAPVSGEGMASRRETSEETYEGQGRGPAGTPGVSANLMEALTTTEGEAGSFTSTQETVEYEHSRRLETRRKAPGTIKRISVAVIVDEDLSGVDLTVLEELVAAAAGVDELRDDTVTVQSMKLEALTLAEKEMKAAEDAARKTQRHSQILALIRHSALVLAGLLILGFVARASRAPLPSLSVTASETAGGADAEGRLPSFEGGEGEMGAEAAGLGPERGSAGLEAPPAMESPRTSEARAVFDTSSGVGAELVELAADDAEQVAKALQRVARRH